jgi:hypothetical protein
LVYYDAIGDEAVELGTYLIVTQIEWHFEGEMSPVGEQLVMKTRHITTGEADSKFRMEGQNHGPQDHGTCSTV